jgi:acyl homoserine lactone synthase
MPTLLVSPGNELSRSDARGMFGLRYSTFKERLDWDVEVDDAQERDVFDDADEVQYILAKSDAGHVDGCWRLLPTLQNYMLSDLFPELLHGMPAPRSPRIWELSRFAVNTRGTAGAGMSFRPLTLQMMSLAYEFAKNRGIHRYVTVTTVAIERLLKRQGVHIHRLGPPLQIGIVMTVACFIEIDDITARAISMVPSATNTIIAT